MPARFVEVTNPIHAARNSDPLAYVHTISWNVSAWGTDAFANWVGAGNSTNSTNSTSFGVSLSRAAAVLSKTSAPGGPARWALYTALVLMVVRWALLQRATRRVVSEYGHAHAE